MYGWPLFSIDTEILGYSNLRIQGHSILQNRTEGFLRPANSADLRMTVLSKKKVTQKTHLVPALLPYSFTLLKSEMGT